MTLTVMPRAALSCATALLKPSSAGLGRRVVGLAHLALAAVDGGDVDDAAKLAARMPSMTSRVMLKTESRLVWITRPSFPWSCDAAWRRA
jgi:hypothetical protein